MPNAASDCSVDDLLRMGWIRGFSRGTLQITLVVLALLIGLRVALPHMVKKYVNKKLDEMPEYDGRIGDVDMHLWMGAYSIQDIEIIKTDGKVPVPFFDAKRVTFSLEWKALFDGALVGEIDFYDPVMNFVQGPTRKSSQVGVDKPWLDVIKKLFRLISIVLQFTTARFITGTSTANGNTNPCKNQIKLWDFAHLNWKLSVIFTQTNFDVSSVRKIRLLRRSRKWRMAQRRQR